MTVVSRSISEADLRAFRENNIFFSQFGEDRLQVGQAVHYDDGAVCEPYAAVCVGNVLHNIGSFSYTFSPLVLGMDIGRYCSISWGLNQIAGAHPIDFVSSSPFTYDVSFAPVAKAMRDADIDHMPRYPSLMLSSEKASLPKIGNDVWIGQDVLLKRNITLGDGCVVGAGSLVTKSVPPYAVVGGNPARIIRMRFPDSIIEKLLALRWWDYSFTDFGTMRYDGPLLFIDEMSAAIGAGRISKMAGSTRTLGEILP